MKALILTLLFLSASAYAKDEPVRVRFVKSQSEQLAQGTTTTIMVPYLKQGKKEFLIAALQDPEAMNRLAARLCDITQGRYGIKRELLEAKVATKPSMYILVLTQVIPPDASEIAVTEDATTVSQTANVFINGVQPAIESLTCTYGKYQTASN